MRGVAYSVRVDRSVEHIVTGMIKNVRRMVVPMYNDERRAHIFSDELSFLVLNLASHSTLAEDLSRGTREAAVFFFFFQAEDGIRDKLVTGVQTCALPISGLSKPISWRSCPMAFGSLR